MYFIASRFIGRKSLDQNGGAGSRTNSYHHAMFTDGKTPPIQHIDLSTPTPTN
jgi:hypothetical protein